MNRKRISILRVLRYLGFTGLLALVATAASAIPINIEFGDVSVAGFSETATGEPTCPPGTACDFRLGARLFKTTVAISQNIQAPNPLEINLTYYVDAEDSLDEETLAFWEERSSSAKERLKAIKKLTLQKSRELRTKRRPPNQSPALRNDIFVPDNDIDPILFSLEWDANYGHSEFLTLNVTDSITGEFSNTQIKLGSVPEPTTMLLLASGLVGLAGFGRKRFKK